MKKRIIILAVVLLALVMSFALTSCEGIVVPGVTTNPPTGNPGGNNNVTKNYTVTYKYLDKTLLVHTVASGSKLSESQLDQKDALSYEGKAFTGFFSDQYCTENFDFDAPITKNTVVYAQIAYNVTYHYGDKVLLRQTIDSALGYFTMDQYEAAMDLSYAMTKITGFFADDKKTVPFDFEMTVTDDVDIYCQILCVVEYRFMGDQLFLKQKVDSVDGFTEELIAQRDSALYHGYNMDFYYSDYLMQNEFDFTSKPLGNITIYCDRDSNKAGKNVTWSIVESTEGTTLRFEGSGPMYTYLYADVDVPWRAYSSKVTDIWVEEGITSIADCAFYKFTGIDSVSFPNTIEHIGARAFYESSVVDIDFPESLISVGENAFTKCEGLTELNFNTGLLKIADGAFWDCINVNTIILTDSILSLGTSAFQNCENLNTAYYTGSEQDYEEINTKISNDWVERLAFKYFYSAEEPANPGPYWKYDEESNIYQWYYSIWYIESTEYRIPFFVDYVDTEIGVTAQNVETMSNIVHNGYKFVGWKKFAGLRVNPTEKYELVEGEIFTNDLKIVGDRGDVCGDNLKWSLDRIGNLTISKIDSTLADGAMWNFKNYNDAPWYNSRSRIKRIVISDGVTHLGSYSFVDIFSKTDAYSQLSYVDIPATVTSIESTAFSLCSHLVYLYYGGNKEQLALVKGTAEFCQAMPNTLIYTAVNEEDFATAGEGAYWCYVEASDRVIRRVAWVYEDGSLLVGGGNTKIGNLDIPAHDTVNYASADKTPWYSYKDDITKVSLNINIVSVGTYNFYGLSNVTEIYVTDRITQISANAFNGTKYYEEMYEKDGVVYVYNASSDVAFKYGHLIKVDPTKNIGLFKIEEKTISIAADAFEGCNGITSIIFTKNIGVKSVHPNALTGLTGLEAIYFYSPILNNEVYTTWFNLYENTLIGEGELLHDVPVYFYSSAPVSGNEYSHWHWNEAKDQPIIYENNQ